VHEQPEPPIWVAEHADSVVRFGTQNPGHPWWVIGAAVTEALVGFHDPLLPSIRVAVTTPSALQGARNNPLEVGDGALDIGITTPSAAALLASRGQGIYDDPVPNLRAIAAYPHIDYLVFAVDQSTGIASFEQLVEQQYPLRVVTGRNAGGQQDMLTYLVEQVLFGYGISYETLEKWGGEVIYGGPTHIGGKLMLEGRADALFQEAQTAYVWPQIADSRPCNFLAVDPDIATRIESALGFERAEMPAGRYRGVDAPVSTVDFSGWLVFCRDDLPADWAYAFARACDRTKELVVEDQEVRRSLRIPIDPTYLFSRTAIPLHEGAAAYALERGYLPSGKTSTTL
jgi:TRAP-type uncharacterized transport system substrate-binding protein